MFDIEAWKAVFGHYQVFLNGLLATLAMAVVGFCIALVIGIILGLFATSGKKPLRIISRIYVEFFQNTPLMLQALFLFYALTFSGLWKITPLVSGMIILGIYHGAYFSEVIRAGIESVPKGQFEASYSQGFTYVRTMQYVVLPQTVKIILPPMVNQIVALIKNTSCMLLVGGAVDSISATNAYAVGASTAQYGPVAYIFSGVIFFAVCFPLSTLAGHWEKKIKKRDEATTDSNKLPPPPDSITDEELDMLIKEGVELNSGNNGGSVNG